MAFLKCLSAILLISSCIYCDAAHLSSRTARHIKTVDQQSTTEAQETTTGKEERIDVHVYYETLCPFSIDFFTDYLEPTMLILHNHIELHLYPYGNADTEEKNGKYATTCQHGESECYGNKLHACAIDILKNETKSLLYTSCMMPLYSDDDAATQCGTTMKINADPIKECARSNKAEELLKHYADLSAKAHYSGVPHVVVRGEKILRRHLKEVVCQALTNPPPVCSEEENASSSETK